MLARHASAVFFICLVAPVFAACPDWRSLERPFGRAIADQQPETVRVTLADSTRIELRNPVVEADSLFGRDGENERVAVASEQIIAADKRVSDVASTAAHSSWWLAVS